MSLTVVRTEPLQPAQQFLASHPQIEDQAPRWARQIQFTSVQDTRAAFTYWFIDDKFEVEENWEYDASQGLTYGVQTYMEDEPGITSKDDALLDLVTHYIEGKDQ